MKPEGASNDGPGIGDGRARLREFGRIAGAIFIVAAIFTIPSSLLIDPRPPLADYTIIGVAVLSGLLCFLIPWERLSVHAFNLLAVIGIAETAYGVAVFDLLTSYFYFLIAVFVAYVLPTRRELVAQLVLIGLAMLAPILYDPDNTRENLRFAIFAIPVCTMAALMVSFLREQLDHNRRTYAELDGEASRVTQRIRETLGRRAVVEIRGEQS